MTQADRKQPEPTEDNWEAEVMRRMARRVENLPAPPDDTGDFGWEEDILKKLRKRLEAE
jgi:hypothetical protein